MFFNFSPSHYQNIETRQAEACPTKSPSIVILRKEWRAGKEAGRRKTWGALLLDSAPPDSSDDSGPVLTKPPSRLGETAIGDFGGKFCCTFHSGLRSSSEHRPGYSLLPHLYQDVLKIAFGARAVNRGSKFCSGLRTRLCEWDLPLKSLPGPFISGERSPRRSCSNAA
jgi:hypothetical protein